MITDIVSLYGQTASVCATLASLGPTVTQVRYFEIVSELSSVFLLPYQFIETFIHSGKHCRVHTTLEMFQNAALFFYGLAHRPH